MHTTMQSLHPSLELDFQGICATEEKERAEIAGLLQTEKHFDWGLLTHWHSASENKNMFAEEGLLSEMLLIAVIVAEQLVRKEKMA